MACRAILGVDRRGSPEECRSIAGTSCQACKDSPLRRGRQERCLRPPSTTRVSRGGSDQGACWEAAAGGRGRHRRGASYRPGTKPRRY
jgi:hypothetical protein